MDALRIVGGAPLEGELGTLELLMTFPVRIGELIAGCEPDTRDAFRRRAAGLSTTYAELSAVYQDSKDGDADIPLK